MLPETTMQYRIPPDVPAALSLPNEPDDDLREPWGDVPAIPAGADWRRSDLVPAGALRAYRRWLACED